MAAAPSDMIARRSGSTEMEGRGQGSRLLNPTRALRGLGIVTVTKPLLYGLRGPQRSAGDAGGQGRAERGGSGVGARGRSVENAARALVPPAATRVPRSAADFT